MVTARTIRAALEGIIYDFGLSKGLPVVFENLDTPVQESTYLTTHLIPAKTTFDTFTGDKQHGIFQINLYTPQRQSVVEADELADEIIALYPVGKLKHITIEQPTCRNQGLYVNGWYAITITVNYRS
ncbi:DUF4128 domain-containing protein [Cardiobacteriaceae bacterium TAE3-ERU3]|nr:DUF4128 domain-containing protein [Cardiobacteriaceae bacterium TAE3-ERU3]